MKKREVIIHKNTQQPPSQQRRTSGKRPKKKMTTKKKKVVAVSVVLAIVMLIGLGAWGANYILNRPLVGNETGDPDIDAALDELITDKVTVLMLGTDAEGVNTDTLMLAMLDCKEKTVNIMSIPRDTLVPNPWGGRGTSKINSVYAAKGMSGIINQVKDLTGLPINYYLMVNFEGFRKAIDVLGGVDFDVPLDLNYDDPSQNLHINLKAGMQHLDGAKSEQLVRSRNQYPMADITRTQVQRDFIKAVIEQHANVGNVTKINELYTTLEPYVKTNVKVGDALRYAPVLAKVESENILLHILPGTTNGSGDYICNVSETEQLIHDAFQMNVKIKSTPAPVTGFSPSSGSSSSSAPKATSPPNKATEKPGTPTQKPAATPTPKPAPTEEPVPTKKPVQPTQAPTVPPEPTQPPVQTQKPVNTPVPTTDTGYPDGI